MTFIPVSFPVLMDFTSFSLLKAGRERARLVGGRSSGCGHKRNYNCLSHGTSDHKGKLFLILEDICKRSQGTLWYGDLSLAFDSHLTLYYILPCIIVISVLSSCHCEPVRDLLAETVLLIVFFSVPNTVPGT